MTFQNGRHGLRVRAVHSQLKQARSRGEAVYKEPARELRRDDGLQRNRAAHGEDGCRSRQHLREPSAADVLHALSIVK